MQASPPSSQSRRGWLWASLANVLAIRLALVGVVWLAVRAIPRLPLYPGQVPDDLLADRAWLAGWVHWDAAHYVAVARYGYGDPASPSPQGGLGFFPLYPLLMRGLAALSGHTGEPAALAIAGLVIANVAFLIAAALLGKLASETIGPARAPQAVLLLAIVPFGHFLGAAYSESLFLALALGSLLLARSEHWWAAAALAGLASATRLAGLALLPALLLLAWRRGGGWRELLPSLLLAPSGFVAFMAYTWVRFGDPLAYFHAQAEWGGWQEHVRFYGELYLRHPREALTGDPRHLVIVVNLALALLFAAAIPAMWRRLDAATACFSTIIILLHIAVTWVSLGRYVVPSVGVYLIAAEMLARPRFPGWPRDLIVVGCAIATTALAILFALGFWIV